MEKLKQLFKKDLSAENKFIVSAALGFALSFNFIFFGMMHIFVSNFEQFMIPLSSVLAAAVITSLVVWLVLSGILAVLPGKIFMLASSLAAGVLIAGYLQGNFLNSFVDLGELTGDAIDWHEHTIYTLLNTVLWLLIISVPAIVRYFASAEIWKRVILIACVLLTGMQATALITSCISNRENLKYVPSMYLSREGLYDVSSESNIIIFVLDRFDYGYIEEVRENDPAFFDRLDGFTDFTNAVSTYPGTFPSAVAMTSGMSYDYIQPRVEYFDYAWNNSEFVKTLKDAGYTMKYHMPSAGYMYTNIEQVAHVADNVREGREVPKMWGRGGIIENFVMLASYRFAPMALKPAFWMESVDIETSGELTNRDYVTNDDWLFMELLKESGLTVQGDNGNYIYFHLYGIHTRNLNEQGEYIGKHYDSVKQVKGCFSILYHYMDEMKRLGVYKDATIIILGDHVRPYAEKVTEKIGFLVKPRGCAGTPPMQNNAPVAVPANLLATIMQSEGMDWSSFGVSAFDVEQDTPGERFVWMYGDSHRRTVGFYRITGDADDFDNWKLMESHDYIVHGFTGLPVEQSDIDE